MAPKEILHTLFLDLQRRVKENAHKTYLGICLNLNWSMLSDKNSTQLDLAGDMLIDLLATWPDGTGSSTYPIPGSPVDRSELMAEFAMRAGLLWDTSTWYGQQRRKLLAWLIKQTSPEPGNEHEQP